MPRERLCPLPGILDPFQLVAFARGPSPELISTDLVAGTPERLRLGMDLGGSCGCYSFTGLMGNIDGPAH